MKIGILSYHFPPEPAFIPGSLAEELAARGHEVRVLTGFPDYPGGHVYPGWRQRWRHQTHSERLTVRRVPRYAGGDGSAGARMASWLSFAGSVALAGRRYLGDVDVLYVYQLPAVSFAAAALLRLLGRVPTVLHVQDVWPEEDPARPGAGDGGPGAWVPPCAGSTRRPRVSPSPRRPCGTWSSRPAPTRTGCGWCSTGPTSGSSTRPSRAGPPGNWSDATAGAW